MLSLNLLGPVTAEMNGSPLTHFGTIRGQALLIYLALERDRAHQREALMHLLWPDMPLKSAQGNLRQTIYLLRKAFQDAGMTESPILSARQTVQLDPDFPLVVDVHQFEAAAAAGTVESRQAAADRYRGPFLADFFLPDSEPFEEWAAARRAAYGRLALENLDQLAAYYLGEANYTAAEEAARRTIALDELHEPAHRHLLQALALSGKRGDALAHYDAFAQQLAEELAIEPDETTQQLLESIRTGQLAVPTSDIRNPKSDIQNLPAQTKPLIGREKELRQLDQFFSAPDTHLVTILGPGGMGKTHLAIEWARGLVETNGQTSYTDGIHFVDLAPLGSIDQVAPAMAEVFTFPLQGERRSPEDQILTYLREKNLLLILDNFEHIIEAANFVSDILRTAPGVRILATSRERLHLSSELIYSLDGLDYPLAPVTGREENAQVSVEDIESYPAMQLLLRRARHIQPDYQLKCEDNLPAARICYATAGMPLAIELAASWIDLLPLGRIADDIERCLDVLETDMRDLPPRHRSIRAAINVSWNNLEPAEQQAFIQLSIFRGGFTWEAAAAVLDTGDGDPLLRRTLSSLRDKSFIAYDNRHGRFTIHELLRQYGSEMLGTFAVEELHMAKEGGEVAFARARHALYFAELLADNESPLQGPQYVETLRLIESDFENVLTTWQWLIDNERHSELAAAMNSLGLFQEIQGYFSTGKRSFSSLANRWRKRLTGEAADSEEYPRDLCFLAKALTWQAAFELDRQQSEALLQESLALLEDPRLDEEGSQVERAFTYYRLGERLQDSHMGRATNYLEKGLALYLGLDDARGAANCFLELGATAFYVNLPKSREYLLQAGRIFEEIGDVCRLGQTLSLLICVAVQMGDRKTMEQAKVKFQGVFATIEQPAFFAETVNVNDLIALEAGLYRQSADCREETIRHYQELGRPALMAKVYLAYVLLHAGQIDQGREMLQELLREIERTGVEHDNRLAFTKHALASQALADEEFATAKDLLQQSIRIDEKNKNFSDLAGAKALTGIAHIGLGDLETAQPYLHSGLKMALDHHGILPLAEALMGIARVLAEQGRTYQARRLYELVWLYPRISRSVLYDGIAGQKIREQTADLSPKDIQTIQNQAAEQDIWQEATTILNQLAAQGWHANSQ